MKETELAQDVVNYLSDYDLYFEVWDVDIIAKMGNIFTSVEVKTLFNFKVIEQGFKNRKIFHYSYIAIPYCENRNFKHKICRDFGIGVLTLHYNRKGKLLDIQETIKPKLNRKASAPSKIKLTEEDKKSIPGASGRDGTTRTAFVITVELIKEYIARHQGCTFDELFTHINHHYYTLSSMKSCLYTYVRDEVIRGISIDKGRLYYSLKDDIKCNTKELN